MEIINNRYRVIRKLGEGGMGSVYLVEDSSENNKQIALKTIKPDKQVLPALERFKSEFKSLTELRHPNLAEVYDFGVIRKSSSEEEDEYFFTLEYVEGKDLFEATENLSYDELYELIVQICRALEYVHLRGVLHNDLKPENILVKSPDKGKSLAKLMDFGLAEEKPTAGKIKGTAHYLAPEIASGKPPTRLTDLYSLGVVLYQVASRKLPFEGNSPIEILKNQIEQEPVPPQRVKPNVPDCLQTIILKLLSKNPENRYQRASEVVEAINSLAHKDFQIDLQDAEQSYLLSGKLIGRQQEISLFQEQIKKLLKDKTGGFLLIRGESGIGKTRLLNEFKYQIQLNKVNFFSGKSSSEGGTPYQPIMEVLKEIFPLLPPESVRKHSWVLQKLIPESLPSVQEFEQIRLNPEQEKLKLFDGVTQLLLEFSESSPAGFSFDDLQLADQATLELLSYICRNIKTYPVLFLGAFQPNELDAEKGTDFFENEISELKGEGLLSEIRLETFEIQEIDELLRSRLGIDSLPPGFSQKLKELTGGNPFFVQEVMKAVIEKKSISKKDLYWSLEKFDFTELQIPRTLKGVLSEKVQQLESEPLSIARTLAVFNRPVDLELLQKALQKQSSVFLPGLDSLQKMEIIKAEKEIGPELFSFTNAQIREVIYEQMDPESKSEIHLAIGLLLENLYGSSRCEHPEELAYHFNNSEDKKKALNYSLLAGRRSNKISANNEACKFFENTLPLLKQKKNNRVETRVYENLIELYQRIGQFDLAIRKFEELEKITSDPRKKANAFEKIGMVYEKKGEFDLGLEHLKKGIGCLQANENSREMARLYYDSGFVHSRKGEFDQSREFYDKALAILKDKTDQISQKEIGKLFNATGVVHWYQGKYDQAVEYYQKSIEIFQKLKEEQELSSPLNNLGNICFDRGDIDRTIEYYQKSLALREKIGDINAMAGSYNNLGNAYYKKGNYAEAMRNYKRSASIYTRIGARSSLIIPLSNIANISLEQSDYRSALEYNQKCMEMSEKVGALVGLAINTHNQGCIYQLLNALDKAIELSHKSYSIKCKLKDTFGKAGTFTLLGDIYRIKGEWFKSEKFLQKAIKIYQELNSKPGEAEALKSWAELNLETGNYSLAFELLKNALKLAEESQDVSLILVSHLVLGKGKLKARLANWNLENFTWEEIEKDLKTALDKAESLQKPELQWEITSVLGDLYQTQRKYTSATKFYKKSINLLREIYTKVPEEYRGSYLAEPKKMQLRKEIASLKEELKTQNKALIGIN
ncbi:MAG TPA: tetratricopeptide repeat protein [Terriglobales bacterium]|nr:tetratricopeptide repeat protein [Terriglobales bacterium]